MMLTQSATLIAGLYAALSLSPADNPGGAATDKRAGIEVSKAVKRHFRHLAGRHRFAFRRIRVEKGVASGGVGLYYAVVPSKRTVDDPYIPVIRCGGQLLLHNAVGSDSTKVRAIRARFSEILPCLQAALPDSLPRIRKKVEEGRFLRLKPGVHVRFR